MTTRARRGRHTPTSPEREWQVRRIAELTLLVVVGGVTLFLVWMALHAV
ncbi:hypothetical protein ACFP3Q_17980 [Nocardioides sp. GCM10027113]